MKITIEIILVVLMVLAFLASLVPVSESKMFNRNASVVTAVILFVLLMFTNLRFV